MVFQVKELVDISPFGKTFFFEQYGEIKKKRKIKKVGRFIPQEEAEKIAKEMCFEKELKQYIDSKTRKHGS